MEKRKNKTKNGWKVKKETETMNKAMYTLTSRERVGRGSIETNQSHFKKSYGPTDQPMDQGTDTGRVSGDDKNRVCSRETQLQREHRFMNFNCPTRE